MKPPAEEQAPLSPHWAFVVQFRVGTEVEQGEVTGRVEHIVSGQAAHFTSLDELVAFIDQVLRRVDVPLPQQTERREFQK